MPKPAFDVCIRGGGIVGRALALKLGQSKLRVALVDRAPQGAVQPTRDIRAYALNHASRTLLQSLRCWPDEAAATPVTHMQVQGDAGGAVRFDAPGITAPAGDTATDPLAWIVDVPALEDLLAAALRFQASVEVVQAPVDAPLTALCEGRDSTSRQAMGAEFEVFDYPQHAIATRVRASTPHHGTASQWFRGPHILALLPLGGPDGSDYAVVWSTDVAEADALMALGDADFASHLQAIASSTAGEAATQHHHPAPVNGAATVTATTDFTLTAERARWPLRLAKARQWVGQIPGQPDAAWALLGDAAHTVHPLAGSGLNLGLGDVAALSEALLQRPAWRSVGDLRLLRNYARERKSALLPYAAATDGLQWLFWQQQPWLQSLRNWGMNGFSASGPLKHWLARQAMGQ